PAGGLEIYAKSAMVGVWSAHLSGQEVAARLPRRDPDVEAFERRDLTELHMPDYGEEDLRRLGIELPPPEKPLVQEQRRGPSDTPRSTENGSNGFRGLKGKRANSSNQLRD